MGTAADERDWETLVSCYTEEPHLDYTSLSGGPDRTRRRPPAGLGAVASPFEVVDAVQHLIGP